MSKGIDISIDALVADFTAYLWTSNIRSFYGRVFRNERNGRISPEVWVTPNKYVEVLKDTAKDAQCFFDVQPSVPMVADICEADIWLCFMVNLQKLYPTLTRTEATEQAHADVLDLIMSSEFTVDKTGLIPGFTGFKDYDWDEAAANMSPHYMFRFNLNKIYSNL
jgi:hypothetical protein